MRIIGNEKGLNIGFCWENEHFFTTSAAELLAGGPQTVVQQQDLPAAAAAAAASCRSNKLQKTPTSRSAVYFVRCSAPAGISTLIFSLSSSSATKQNKKKKKKKSDTALVPNSRRSN